VSRPALAWLAVVAAIAACDQPPAARRAAVTSGTEGGLPGVVAVVDASDAVVCSGALIGTRTVITAGHCSLATQDVTSLRVFFGTSVAAGGEEIAICDSALHPAFDPTTFAGDLLLLRLDRDAPVEGFLLDPGPFGAELVGTDLEVAGFGRSAAASSDAGTLRTGTAQVSAVTDTEIEVVPGPAQPCAGDSGGPAFIDVAGTPHLIATVSHGDAACVDHAYLTRVDVAGDFINPFLDRDCDDGCAAGGGAGSAGLAALLLVAAHSIRRRTTKRPIRVSSR